MAQAWPIPECALLSLSELRSYRTSLNEEELKVSYWRRIIQARADVTQARKANAFDLEALKRVLAGDHLVTARTSLLRMTGAETTPPLPDIAALWTRLDDPTDESTRAELIAALRRADQQLSAYRHDLHTRIAAATAELIARYHANPSLCLSALPLQHRQAS